MAGRFLYQKLASRMSRSTSLLGAHASSPVTRRALEGGVATLDNFSYGPVLHPSIAVPNNPRIYGCEGGLRILRNIFCGTSAHPSTLLPSVRGIHGSPARYLSTLNGTPASCFRSFPPKGLPPVTRVARNISSNSPAKDTISWERTLSSRKAELQARCNADLAAWIAKKDADAAAFTRFVAIIGSAWGLIFLCWISMPGFGPSHHGMSSCEGQSGSYCCSSCCKCQTGSSKSNC